MLKSSVAWREMKTCVNHTVETHRFQGFHNILPIRPPPSSSLAFYFSSLEKKGIGAAYSCFDGDLSTQLVASIGQPDVVRVGSATGRSRMRFHPLKNRVSCVADRLRSEQNAGGCMKWENLGGGGERGGCKIRWNDFF